jgi:hypothetical protein
MVAPFSEQRRGIPGRCFVTYFQMILMTDET